MTRVLHGVKLSLTNEGLYLNPVWLVLTAAIVECCEWAQATSVLLRNCGGVYWGEGPAVYGCLMWSFPTITPTHSVLCIESLLGPSRRAS